MLPRWTVWAIRIVGGVLLAWICLAAVMAAALRLADAETVDTPPAMNARGER